MLSRGLVTYKTRESYTVHKKILVQPYACTMPDVGRSTGVNVTGERGTVVCKRGIYEARSEERVREYFPKVSKDLTPSPFYPTCVTCARYGTASGGAHSPGLWKSVKTRR